MRAARREARLLVIGYVGAGHLLGGYGAGRRLVRGLVRGETLRAVVGLVLLALAAAACGSDGDRTTFRIYDPSNQAAPQVTGGDVVPSSVRVARGFGRSGVVYLRLTRDGARKFGVLTRGLARRGARVNRPQSFAIEVNGRVLSRIEVDYQLFPNGISGTASEGVEIAGPRLSEAREIAEDIRAAAS